MAEIILPRRIIANKCMPGGWRGPKKPVLIVPGYSPGVHISRFASKNDKEGFQPVVIPKVFENWEYRFWAMAMINTRPASECRCCGAEGGANTRERQEHFEKNNCTKRLCKAYDLLIKDKICVICDKRTGLRKWGVPLCSPACEQQWCENEAQPKCLTAALLLVGEV